MESPVTGIFTVKSQYIVMEENSGTNYDKFLAYLILAFNVNVWNNYDDVELRPNRGESWQSLLDKLRNTPALSEKNISVTFTQI